MYYSMSPSVSEFILQHRHVLFIQEQCNDLWFGKIVNEICALNKNENNEVNQSVDTLKES